VAVTAKSLILDLLSTLKGGSMPVRALVAAGDVFGLEENGVRVALARLLAAGLVERDERGQYRPGSRAEALQREVTSWRTVEDGLRRWQGDWAGVHVGALPRSARDRAARTRALRLVGFRELAPRLEIRPDNLAGGVEALRGRLRALGLEQSAIVFRLGALDRATEARARDLWDTTALRSAYREARAEIARSEKRLPTLPRHAAMTESFVLGGRVIRQIVLDPLLPEPIVPAGERQALVAAMRRYDRVGRACWADFLREFGVLHDRTPADLRLADGAARAAGAQA